MVYEFEFGAQYDARWEQKRAAAVVGRINYNSTVHVRPPGGIHDQIKFEILHQSDFEFLNNNNNVAQCDAMGRARWQSDNAIN